MLHLLVELYNKTKTGRVTKYRCFSKFYLFEFARMSETYMTERLTPEIRDSVCNTHFISETPANIYSPSSWKKTCSNLGVRTYLFYIPVSIMELHHDE